MGEIRMDTVTDIINFFDIDNQINEIVGTFRYRFFDPIEQIDENCRFLNPNEIERDVPRYCLVTWKTGQKEIVDIGLQDFHTFTHKENFFFASDLSPTYCVLVRDDKKMLQNQSHVISDNATTGSKLDYLLKTVNSNEYTEQLEENLDVVGSPTVIPVVDPTTNRPVEKVDINDKSQSPDMQIRAINSYSILKASQRSPLNRGIYDSVVEKAQIIQKQRNSLPKEERHSRKLTTLFTTIETIKEAGETSFFQISRAGKPDDYLQQWSLVGFVISKYRLQDDQEVYMYSRFSKITKLRDPYVAYGQTYRYQIRPVYGKYVNNKRIGSSYLDNTVAFIGSSESASIDVECTELKVPSPPRNPRFEYIGNSNLKVSWERPSSYVSDEDKIFDTNDIKGYQILIRNSLIEPYRLFRYFTFNNTKPENLRMRSLETISDDYIISSEYSVPDTVAPDDIPEFYEYTEYILPIRSNMDYYFALCSIDAHGNSSEYSAQYKVRRNNVTGEVDIQLVCPVGAPKQYPNMLIPGKLVQPSFKVSGYKYMDTYFAPDAAVSMPSFGGEGANIQLFELETEVEKNIKITLNQMPKSSK